MLEIKRETDYAIQMLIILGQNKDNFISLQIISEKTKISFHFLQKIARKLKIQKIIKSTQGIKGGYSLIKNPKQITLKEIIEAMEGEIALIPCLKKNKKINCVNKKNKQCILQKKLVKINKQIVDSLLKIKLANLIYDKTN